MMNLISGTDIIDLYHKIHERGLSFILDKLSFSRRKRIYNAWKDLNLNSSSWWIIESVRRRWNQKITGSVELEYEQYVADNYLKNKSNLLLLSVGCGSGSHEIKFAKTGAFDKIIGLDIATGSLKIARTAAADQKLQNIQFIESSFENYSTTERFDVVLFHSSLHHFRHIDATLEKASALLNKAGILIINEYVGPDRFQFSRERLKNINVALKTVPKHFRKRQFTRFYKSKVYSPGLLRMILADPSEASNSGEILKTLHQKFEILEEKKLGGDILHPLLKDIAHNFVPETNEAIKVLTHLFAVEDDYIRSKSQSDFMFGIYMKKSSPTHIYTHL